MYRVCCLFSSSSSTPIGAAIISISALAFWKIRSHYKRILTLTISLIFFIQLFRERPVWYLIALVDFTGGSTGWHRSYLIDTAFKHIDEWWLAGSDYTRHWMPYGLASVPEHCDLTNYYIHLGVIGGLPLMLIFCTILYRTFRALTIVHNQTSNNFLNWCIVSLFITHTITFLTISYFDQTYVLLYAPIGMVANLAYTNILKPNISENSSL